MVVIVKRTPYVAVRLSQPAYQRVSDLAQRADLSRAQVLETLSHAGFDELLRLDSKRRRTEPGRMAGARGSGPGPVEKND